MNKQIHVVIIRHAGLSSACAAVTLRAADTEEALERSVAAYCRDFWHTTSVARSGCQLPPPANDRKCVDAYFAKHETDTIEWHSVVAELTAPSVDQMMRAHDRREFVESLESAAEAVGGGADTWTRTSNMTMAEAEALLSPNGIRFVAVPRSDNARALLRDEIENFVKTYHYMDGAV